MPPIGKNQMQSIKQPIDVPMFERTKSKRFRNFNSKLTCLLQKFERVLFGGAFSISDFIIVWYNKNNHCKSDFITLDGYLEWIQVDNWQSIHISLNFF